MLILERRKNEVVIIAGCIKIIVVEIRGNTVRLGFDAPKDVAVDREEVHLSKQRDKSESQVV